MGNSPVRVVQRGRQSLALVTHGAAHRLIGMGCQQVARMDLVRVLRAVHERIIHAQVANHAAVDHPQLLIVDLHELRRRTGDLCRFRGILDPRGQQRVVLALILFPRGSQLDPVVDQAQDQNGQRGDAEVDPECHVTPCQMLNHSVVKTYLISNANRNTIFAGTPIISNSRIMVTR